MRMLATNREPAPPGEMLREESRKPLGLTMRLAKIIPVIGTA